MNQVTLSESDRVASANEKLAKILKVLVVSIPVFYVYREQLFSLLSTLDKIACATLSRALIYILNRVDSTSTIVPDPTLIMPTVGYPEWIIKFNTMEIRVFLNIFLYWCYSASMSLLCTYSIQLGVCRFLLKYVTDLFGLNTGSDVAKTPAGCLDLMDKQLDIASNLVSALAWKAVCFQLHQLGTDFVSSLASTDPFPFLCLGFYAFLVYKIIVSPKAKKLSSDIIIEIEPDMISEPQSGIVRVEPIILTTEPPTMTKNGLPILPRV